MLLNTAAEASLTFKVPVQLSDSTTEYYKGPFCIKISYRAEY